MKKLGRRIACLLRADDVIPSLLASCMASVATSATATLSALASEPVFFLFDILLLGPIFILSLLYGVRGMKTKTYERYRVEPPRLGYASEYPLFLVLLLVLHPLGLLCCGPDPIRPEIAYLVLFLHYDSILFIPLACPQYSDKHHSSRPDHCSIR